MSSALVWEIVKNHNSFLKKGPNGSLFTTEPGNLLNKHSAQFSGLANYGKTVDVALSGKGIVLKTSSKKKGGKLVSQQTKTSAARAARSAAAVARNAGRPDLQRAARAKASTLYLVKLRKQAAQKKQQKAAKAE
ncbi:hypothetical protein QBZ16_000464 [Prototheca wickerhamii]|uniref:Ribosomal eL28/Mak16 domain-containing protein n=1 Tax=Prototheca wickerhamii TaxID=3111 RepID=A0AAD9MM37_PROWI|nr:hypothetical protein QBZ16_000464 [Prototheca wickerhamii]